jgi:DNA-binding transcriptional LysR family regulator
MQGMIPWDDLRVALAVHRGRTLAAAGRMLGVDATTVGRRLTALEGALGARLFDRTPEGFTPTDAGRRAIAIAERTEDGVTDLARAVGGADARIEGTVRLTAGDGMLANVLVPALPVLLARHPGLRLELLAATRAYDLARREADLAVRLFRPREPALVTRRLADLPYGLYASPSYVARRGAPLRVSDLEKHDLLGFDASLERTPEMRWLLDRVPEDRFVARCSTTPVLVAACRAGLGIMACATPIAASEPELVRVLPRAALPAREAWAVYHPDLRSSARVGAVLAWLSETLAAAPARPGKEATGAA